MKKNILGAVVFFSLLALAGLSMYIYAARTGSGHRLREFDRTAVYLEERLGAMEKQRALLGETAAALDAQATDLRQRADELSRRVEQIDSEIANMRDLIGGARKTVRAPLFNLRSFRLTAGSGLLVVAFLAFIWLLYTSLRSRGEEEPYLSDVESPPEPAESAPVPGSVREEEFEAQPPPEPGGGESSESDTPLDTEGEQSRKSGATTAMEAEEPVAQEDGGDREDSGDEEEQHTEERL